MNAGSVLNGINDIIVMAQTMLPTNVPEPSDTTLRVSDVVSAAVRLTLASALAAALALRPRRAGTPERRPAVVHTQIILAVVGALVMLVVGSSLARAFGIVGAAGLVRYRAKIEDPKDAGVMLSTLAVGLATGVGLWPIAIVGTVFLLGLLWLVESFERTATRLLVVTIKREAAADFKQRVQALFTRLRVAYDVSAISPDELVYEVRWPINRPTALVSERIAALDRQQMVDVHVEAKKEK